jgi:PPOX class probable F420-dependent enzyme
MTNTTDIASNKYVSLTTYTKDGTPKPLPVWIAELSDGRLGFTTSIDSWKVRRIKNTPTVTLRACDMRGNVADDAAEVSGQATVGSDEDFAQVQKMIKEKYGFAVTMIKALNSVRGLFTKDETQSTSAVIITLD